MLTPREKKLIECMKIHADEGEVMAGVGEFCMWLDEQPEDEEEAEDEDEDESEPIEGNDVW